MERQIKSKCIKGNKPDTSALEVATSLLNEKLELLNGKLDRFKENAANNKIEKCQKENVCNRNKLSKDWPYSCYTSCFNKPTIIEDIKYLIPTVSVKLECNGVMYGPFKAMLDTGAQPNLISDALYNRIKCPTSEGIRKLVGIDSKPFMIKRKTEINVRPWFDSDCCIKETFWVLPEQNEFCPLVPSAEFDVSQNKYILDGNLADPLYFKPDQVHITLGVGFVAKIFDRYIRTLQDGTTLISTTFGIVVMGEHIESIDVHTGKVFSLVDDALNEKLNGMIEKLWKQDDIESVVGAASNLTEEQLMVEEHFVNTHYRDANGRFVVKIPFKHGINYIGSSRQIALRRFISTEKRLESIPKLKEFYVNEMRELKRNGHMVEVTRPPLPGKICYHIPHHCVLKKPRVVYDASCKTNFGKSLNEVQMLGAKLQTELHTTLMRFRRHKIAVCGDIKKMFNQVRVNEEDWDCQRIFWRESPDLQIKEYWLTVVTFGLTSSAHLAVRCIIQAAKEAADTLPGAAKAIIEDFYMDDCVTGADSVEEAIKLAKQISQILAAAGFQLRKWKSNDQAVVQALESNELDCEDSSCMVFSGDSLTSVLGVKWLNQVDQFTYVVKTPIPTGKLTKRKIVSCSAQLFDPNGYISPVIVILKMIIQELWKSGIDWDEEVSQGIQDLWANVWKEIILLEKIRIPRWYGTLGASKTTLIGFSDSSKKAFGAAIYARTQYPNGSVRCHLVASKTRVAPLKEVTIPRLELAAAELLSRLLLDISTSIEFEGDEAILWTDSAVTLFWIRKEPANLKEFVANRVRDIQKRTTVKMWRYVNTKQNPADLLSRGGKPSELMDNKLWWHGPEWLQWPESQWPDEQFPLLQADSDVLELKVYSVTNFSAALDISKGDKGMDWRQRISVLEYADKLEKALRILAYCFRYVKARLAKYKPPARVSRSVSMIIAPPSQTEKGYAMKYFIRQSQREYYNREYTALAANRQLPDKSQLEPLKPFLDKQGLIRVGGRLDRSDLTYDMKHPIIIPKGSRLSWLVMDFSHRVNHHGGIQLMMQHIRRNYWILRLRDELKRYTRTCVECVRQKQINEEQIMADLPADRVIPGPKAFVSVGVDYAGPFQVRFLDKENKVIAQHKCWAVVFVCMKTRAIHLDLVTDLTSASFVACFERFVARRGRCVRLFSDNGTSFIGAERVIGKAYKEWLTDGTVDRIANKGTSWKFMTPAAPHQGGIYEAAVKSMKFHLKRVVGARVMEYQQFITLLCQIEGILNSRPLTPLTDDPQDLQALTPGHFLVSEPLVALPPFEFANENNLQAKRLWNVRQKMFTDFWHRWESEYLATLQERKKWRRERENVRVGQLVLLKDENLPPASWKMGRIREVFPDSKGAVRSVTVETATTVLKRPVQKICILPVECAINEETYVALRTLLEP